MRIEGDRESRLKKNLGNQAMGKTVDSFLLVAQVCELIKEGPAKNRRRIEKLLKDARQKLSDEESLANILSLFDPDEAGTLPED